MAKLEFDNIDKRNSGIYEVRRIRDNAIYTRKSLTSHLSRL